MVSNSPAAPLTWPIAAWFFAALAGFIAPAFALLALGPVDGSAPVLGSMLALGLMGSGMIGAAAAGRLVTGLCLAILAGLCLTALQWATGMPALPNPIAMGAVFVIASLSFAARGYLFARSAGGKGWGIAVFVVSGEAAILLTALAQPGLLPDWLLVLLPAQWANMAIETVLSGSRLLGSVWALTALLGTAAATLLVAGLWPARWPYLVMFTAWLALSALVYHGSGFGAGFGAGFGDRLAG